MTNSRNYAIPHDTKAKAARQPIQRFPSAESRDSSSLGSIAEFSSATSFLPPELRSEADRIAELVESEKRRWKRTFDRMNTARRLLPKERIAQCQRSIAPGCAYSVVNYDPDRDRAAYHNLVCCEGGSCAFCVKWRSEAIRQELSAGLAMALNINLFPLLVTVTVSHQKSDSLEALRAAINASLDRVFSGRWWQRSKKKWGYVGKIRVIETTYGRHGWHPHYHLLIYLDIELVGPALEAFRLELAAKWAESLKKEGFSASLEHGVDVKVADSEMAAYIAKYGKEPEKRSWGADSEMAKSLAKSAAFDGMTPFELNDAAGGDSEALSRLALLLGTDDLAAARERAGQLFSEYYFAMRGRSLVHWSKGLKERLEVDETLYRLREAEAEKAAQNEAFDLALLDSESWVRVVSKDHDLRAELLGVASEGNTAKLAAWFASYGIVAIIPDEAASRSAKLILEREADRAGPDKESPWNPGGPGKPPNGPPGHKSAKNAESALHGENSACSVSGRQIHENGPTARKMAESGDSANLGQSANFADSVFYFVTGTSS